MDILSHAGWGVASLRWRRSAALWPAAVAGMAPDLLFFLPWRVEMLLRKGWAGLRVEGTQTPGIWRADGPPLPPELAQAYFDYYRYTHSLVLLALVAAALWALGRRGWLWPLVPYGLHILMDIPTHERFRPPFLYPLSSWTFSGLSWGHPLIFFPNWIALVAVHIWLWRKYRPRHETKT